MKSTRNHQRDYLHLYVSTLAIALGILFIAYCLVYLCACPSQALAIAVCAEIAGLAISIIIWRAGVFSIPSFLLSKIPEAINTRLKQLGRFLDWLKIAVFSVVLLLALADFSALCFSAVGLSAPAVALYTFLPSTYWIGLHPAFSLEMLAGALVEHRELDRAEPLYKEILDIRLRLSGPNSDLASAIYADLGDLYVRKNDLVTAEHWYRRTIAIGPRTGRGYTALATLLRERGLYAESEQYYLKALALRKHIYGMQSKQYNDTLRGYLQLKQLMTAQTGPVKSQIDTHARQP